MKTVMALLSLANSPTAKAQTNKSTTKVESMIFEYKGKAVKAKKLTVNSQIAMDIDHAWNNLKTPELLQFVAKGMIRFKSTAGGFPKT
jgi:hypothetical protein